MKNILKHLTIALLGSLLAVTGCSMNYVKHGNDVVFRGSFAQDAEIGQLHYSTTQPSGSENFELNGTKTQAKLELLKLLELLK